MPAKLQNLLEKNIILEIRSWKKTLCEVLLLILCFVIVALNPIANILYQVLDESEMSQTKIYASLMLDDLSIPLAVASAPTEVLYTPKSTFATNIMDGVAEALSITATGFKNELEMMDTFDEEKILAAVAFTEENTDIVKHLKVAIRFPYQFRSHKDDVMAKNLWAARCDGAITDDVDNEEDYMQTDLYIREGFLQLQHQIFVHWFTQLMIEYDQEIMELPQVTVKMFRHNTEKEICSMVGTSNLTMFLYSFAFFLPYLNLLWKYGREREENIPAHHWRYGYSYFSYWLGHYLVSFLHLFILDLVVLIVLKIPLRSDVNTGSFTNTSFVLLLGFLALYNIAMMLCVVVLVTMSSRAYHAVLLGAVLWLSMFSLFAIVIENETTMLTPLMTFICVLFFNNGFAWGMRYLKQTSMPGFELWMLFSVIAGSAFLSAVILQIIQYLFQGRYVNCMPLKILCWSPKKATKDKGSSVKVVVFSDQMPSWENFEFGPMSGGKLVTFKNVGYYRGRTKKYLLKPMHLRIFKGEITVLVGPHSSGKTTLMSIIAGWKRPHTGSVFIEKHNLFEDWSKAYQLVDVSMPNNPLFDLLTVQETLVYYVKIKLPKDDEQKVRMELDKWFEAMKPAKVNRSALVKDLTFEHKRLVSLCCTLCANRRVVLLDEPTIKMRSPEQHLYWSILQREKPDRAILVATFDLEEAEVIGDRIAFLIDGILQASGTPFFLKTKFVSVCDLILLKAPEAVSEPITQLISQFIPDIVPENEIGNQLFYKLPVKNRNVYQNLLIHLRKEQANLGITNIRILGCELSDVYMSLDKHKNNQIIVNDSKKNITYVSKSAVGKQHTYALLYKKLLHQAPNWIPIITFGACFLLVVLVANMSDVLRAHSHGNRMFLGLNESESSRGMIIKTDDCNFVEIREINPGNMALFKASTRSLLFTSKSFNCLEESYESYLMKSKTMHDKFGGVEIGPNNYTVWINGRIFHSAPLALNLVHNIILNKNFDNDTMILASIVNNPLPVPLRTKINLMDQEMMHMVLPMVLGVVVPVSIGCFILPLVEERIHHLLHLQRMAGISIKKYWLVNLLWDWGTYFSYTIVYVIVLAICTLDGFGFYEKLLTMLLLDIYGFAGLTMVYLTSLFFYYSLWSSFLIVVLFQLTTGIVAYIVYWDVIDNITIYFYVFSLFPSFSLLDGISNIYAETQEQSYCRERCNRNLNCNSDNICETVPQCCAETFFKFSDPGILTSIAFMLFSAIICWLLIIWVEKRRMKRKFRTKMDVKSFHSACYPYDDRDVVAVKKMVAEQDLRTSLRKHLMVDQLEYRLRTDSKELQTVSFIVEAGSCTGIYGSRCCGKSHLIRQLVGEDSFYFGDVYIEGHEMKRRRRAVYAAMSYAPQDYRLWYTFTPREILRFFCMARCIEPDDIPAVLRDLAATFDMRPYMDKRISTLNVNRRRKVSIAIAMIAQHKVIVLDEPTRGLAPHTAREIWNVLRFKRFGGKAIVFSTSSTAELQALCDQVIVVDEGEMWAVGSVQYLRQKYTRGFYLDVKLKRDGLTSEEASENLHKDSENLQRFVTFLHEESELQYRIDNWFRFYLPVPIVNYVNLYGALEKNRRRLNIADYAVSQGTMENVLVMIYNIRRHRRQVQATARR